MKLITRDSPREVVESRSGGKGRNLWALTREGLPVPEWAIVGIDVFRHFRRLHGLDERIGALVSGVTANSAGPVARTIEEMIVGAELDQTILALLQEACAHVGAEAVAVRSSGADEDAGDLSFAGQFSTFLNVRGVASAATHVKKCWAAAYSERAFLYREACGRRDARVEMAVIVQRMVRAETSGVVFTHNPTSGRRDEMVVSAVFGLGEGLVSGAVDADTIVVERPSGAVKQVLVGEKQEAWEVAPAGEGCQVLEVAETRRSGLALTPAEVAAITVTAARIETVFGTPQDVEWAFAGGALWILQTRPITSAACRGGEALRVWDNSNIIESFGDVTSTLTFSFARHAYHQVYRSYCEVLGVPARYLREMDQYLDNMLGHVNGRVYYNLLNWYRVIRLVPFYELNRTVMEIAMGVEERLDAELADSLHPFVAHSRADSARIRLRIALRFAWYFLTIGRWVARFRRHFYAVYERFEAISYNELTAGEVYLQVQALEREVLGRWGHMIVLEAVIALSFGIFHLLTRRWLPETPEWFRYDAIRVSGAESAEPARRLVELAELVRARPILERIVRTTPSREARAAIAAAGEDVFLAAMADYIARYGYRSVNELKLEEPDLREDDSVFFDLLRSVLASDRADVTTSLAGAGDRARRYLRENLRGWRRVVYDVVRRKLTACLQARESVRFCRTRAFGLARRMFRAIGLHLARIGAIEDDRDVFHLRLEEIRGWFEATVPGCELKALVAVRKRERDAALATERAPSRFVTRGPVYWPGTLELAGWRREGRREDPLAPRAERRRELRGTPCSPGLVEGEAQVVTAPRDAGGRILVTYRTDPGWIAALPSATALLIERGSPLTHVAIVARELGIPTVVQIKNLTEEVETGMRLRVHGDSGTVTILAPPDDTAALDAPRAPAGHPG